MADIVIGRSEHLEGEVRAPASKAYTHRTLISASLSSGTSEISNPLIADDTEATLEAIRALGAGVERRENLWEIKGVEALKAPKHPIDCGESGATLRFMIPVAALAPSSSILAFGASLERRPVAPLLQSLKQLGAESDLQLKEGRSLVRVHGGGIAGGKTSIRGDISSQFVSGLMFACPMAREDSEITVTTPLESRSYVKTTVEVLKKHGVRVTASDDLRRFQIPSDQKYKPCNHDIQGDFSSAAFLLAAAAVTSSKITITNLGHCTIQGDEAILNILEDMGSKMTIGEESVEIEGGQLTATDVDAKDIPDLVPVCAALACSSSGTTRIHNAKRLRYKESDRLASLYIELQKMGADIMLNENGLIIRGPCAMRGALIDPHNDHRIAMACAIAALGAEGETRIQSSECVSKSYPRFFHDLRSLGADVRGD